MNKVYNVIWNKTKKCYVVVSELVKNNGGKVKNKKSSISSVRKLSTVALAGLFAIICSNSTEAALIIDNVDMNGYAKGRNQLSNGNALYNYYNPGNMAALDGSRINDTSYSDTNLSGLSIGQYNNILASERPGYYSGIAIGNKVSATGSQAFAIGNYAQATDLSSMAFGNATLSSGFNSLAMMRQAAATKDFATAIGTASWANGVGSFAMGYSATAKADQSIAIGAADTIKNQEDPSTPVARYNADNNTVTEGVRSLAFGTAARTAAGADDSMAFGSKARTNAANAVAIGYSSEANGIDSFAMGNTAISKGSGSTAIGNSSVADGDNAIAMGKSSQANMNNAIALGGSATALGEDALAIGVAANASSDGSIAVGKGASATSTNTTAIGFGAKVSGRDSMAIGTNAIVDVNNSLALGSGTEIRGSLVNGYSAFTNKQNDNVNNGVVSVGNTGSERRIINVAGGEKNTDAVNVEQLKYVNNNLAQSLAGSSYTGYEANGSTYKAPEFNIKNSTYNNVKEAVEAAQTNFFSTNGTSSDANYDNKGATGTNATAAGVRASAAGNNAIALGMNSNAGGLSSIAIGDNARSSQNHAVAIGNLANVSGTNSVALGNNNTITGNNTVALGSGITANNSNNVILGNNSSDEAAVQVVSGSIPYGSGTLTYGNFAGTATGVVSVGSEGAERQIVNVAPGAISQESTDAINGSQLYQATKSLIEQGLSFKGDDSTVVHKQLGEQLEIVGGANKATLTDNNIGVNNVDGKLKVQLAKQINLGKDGSVTTGNTVVNNAGLTITNPAGTVSLTNTGLNNGGNQIKNIDAGTEATDAVNVSQLKAAKTEVVAGSNVTVDSKTGTEGQTIYTVNAKAVDLGSTTLTYKANGANEQTVTVTDGLNFTDGNYTTASVDAAGVVKYDVNLGSITQGADGKPGVNGKDGIATVQTVVDTINNSGWKANATGNVAGSATATVVKPGTTVNYAAGSNLTVAQAIDSNGDHTYTYDLANDITVGKDGVDGVDGQIGVNGKDGSAVVVNGKDGSIGLNGANGTNGLTIKGDKGATGVDGTDGAKGTDGMTRIVYTDGKGTPHEVATLDDGMKFAGDDGQTDTNQVIAKKLNTVVDIVGGANKAELTDNNIGVNNVDGKLKVQLAKQINLGKDGSVTTGNTVVNNAGLTITNPAGTVSLTNTGLNNGGNQIKNIGAGTDDTDAVNVKQLKDKVTTVQSSDSSISVVDTNTDPNKGHTYDIKVNNQHIVENAQTSVVYTDATGNKLYKQNDGTFNTQPDGSGTTIQPVDVIASMNNGANSTTTPMILNNVGSAIQKPNATATFLEQLDTANTTTPNAAVNVSDLKQTADSLVTKGLSFKGDDSTVVHKQLGEQLEIVGGADKATLTDNNIGVNNVNGQLKVQLAKDINLGPNGSVTTGDTVINNNGLTINGGPSITKAGIDASGQKITNIADGEISSTSKDAINGSQLYNAVSKAKTTVSAGDNIVVTSSTDATDGHTNYKVSLTPKVSIGDTTHKVIIDGPKGEITGLTNTTITSPDFGKSGRAATEEQLQAGIASATSIEKVQAKSDRNNIAQVEPKAGDTFGSKGATYEVFVDKNIVKDASREAVNVTSKDKAITVTPNKDDGNHTTTYELIFNGKDAAKEIPLTYRANGANEHQVMLADGLNFVDGQNTKASVGVNGKVTFDVSGDLKQITSISNQGSATMNFGSDAITINGGTLNMGGNKITNVAPGTSGTDVVNLNQLKAARTSVTSEDGSVMIKPTEDRTTGQINYDLSAHDTRVDALAEEIGKVGSQGAALAALKPIQYDPLEPTQVMAGYGNYRGNSAIALGVAHYKNESTMLHVGMSWAGGSSHMMANAGVTWKIGNRDSEAAIADRYRKGPVSSAYALQQEMAAMKAQNAGLKGEVADLKAENEQMKAQIAAMMAKLGL